MGNTKNKFKSYRILALTEIIEKGDQVYKNQTRGWMFCTVGVGSPAADWPGYRIRRPLKSAVATDDTFKAVTEPVVEYYYLKAGEVIQAEDEWKTHYGQWNKVMRGTAGEKLWAENVGRCRRKVAPVAETCADTLTISDPPVPQLPQYRLLVPGEVVLPDDEYASFWNKASFADGVIKVARTGKFRRKVSR
jgi:hypothetical protein